MKKGGFWRWQTKCLLFALLGGAVWLYLSVFSMGSNNWSWEEQVAMEAAMMKVANENPGRIPEIDQQIPETETALFALG